MTNECDPIIDADAEWPETQTGGEDSECDPIIVAGENSPFLESDGDRDQSHALDEFGIVR